MSGSNDQILVLRQELKTWEKSFAAANEGRKAGRDDIKKDAVIAAKYREYDRLRRPQSKNLETRSKSFTAQPHKEPESVTTTVEPTATPQKRARLSNFAALPFSLADEEVEPTPAAIRLQLGPTPQKDGHILSLFDSFPSVTPSKSRSALAAIPGNVAATPSKKQQDGDSFSTPLKRKRDDQDDSHATPSSSMKLLTTPAFLRRSNTVSIMESLAEEAENDNEMFGLTRPRDPAFKTKKKGFIRSLSTIIQSMRKQEDDDLDEQLDIMRDMEGFDDMDQPPPTKVLPAPKVMVEDSQVVMPLGPDRAEESEESEEDDQGGPPRKAWKKKGLKRQTKRVIMRPVTQKPKKVDTPNPDPESDVEGDGEVVADTQLVSDNAANHVDDDESDYSDTEAKLQRSLEKSTTKPIDSAITKTTTSTKEPEGAVKKAARMISSGAHANFRKLKIRNKNSKANGKGRFGRR